MCNMGAPWVCRSKLHFNTQIGIIEKALGERLDNPSFFIIFFHIFFFIILILYFGQW